MMTLDGFMAGWTRTTPEEDAQLEAERAAYDALMAARNRAIVLA
jgi:hypothetical protein